MTEIYTPHTTHRLQHATVFLLFATGVAFVANEMTGGVENISRIWTEAYDTHAGLKNINLDDSRSSAQSSIVGTATSGCLDSDNFSANRVHQIHENPNTYSVTVKKIGAGTLDAAAVEQCVFEQTHIHTTVVQESAH